MWANFGFKSSLLMLLLGLFSCSTLYQRKHSDECGAFFENIKQNWAYNPSTKMYEWKNGAMNKDEMVYLDNEKCFLGISKKNIEKVMGKPTKATNDGWIYQYKYVFPNEKAFYGFKFDSSGRTLKVEHWVKSIILSK